MIKNLIKVKILQNKPKQCIQDSDINKIYLEGPIISFEKIWGVLWSKQLMTHRYEANISVLE